jgi:hypothetical protein
MFRVLRFSYVTLPVCLTLLVGARVIYRNQMPIYKR